MALPLIIGAGMAAAGAIGHFAGVGRMNVSRRDLDYDPSNLAFQDYRRMSDPTYGQGQFMEMAERSALSRSDALNAATLSGRMGAGQALAQADASRGQARDQANYAFKDFRLGADRVAQGALGMHLQKEQFITEGMFNAKAYNAQRSASFVSNLMSGGMGLMGRAMVPKPEGFGGMPPPPPPGQPPAAQGSSMLHPDFPVTNTPFNYQSPGVGASYFPTLDEGRRYGIGNTGYPVSAPGGMQGMGGYPGLGYGGGADLPSYIMSLYGR